MGRGRGQSHMSILKTIPERNNGCLTRRSTGRVSGGRPQPSAGAAILSVSVSMEGGKHEARIWKSAMMAAAKERNRLIHQMLVGFDPQSADSCEGCAPNWMLSVKAFFNRMLTWSRSCLRSKLATENSPKRVICIFSSMATRCRMAPNPAVNRTRRFNASTWRALARRAGYLTR
jgi:hypothetical protein